MASVTKFFNWKIALIWHTIFFSFAMLQELPLLGMLWLIINTFVFLLLLRAVYAPVDDKNSNRVMAWYFYILSIFTDLLSLCIFGQHIVDEKIFLAVFVLIMGVFILLPKPLFAYFLFKSLQNDEFDVMKGLDFGKLIMNNDGDYERLTELEDSDQQRKRENSKEKNMKEEEQKIKEEMMTCDPDLVIPPEDPQQPKEGARAFFSGVLVGPRVDENWTVPYDENCPHSEYVGEGAYPKNEEAFPTAVSTTFDGIAIDSNTRVILYEKQNFEGKVLLDVVGPKIICNTYFKEYHGSKYHTDFEDPEIQKNYPADVRIWSETNMHPWSYGSVKIVAAP